MKMLIQYRLSSFFIVLTLFIVGECQIREAKKKREKTRLGTGFTWNRGKHGLP
jgi:hypothetical protein